MGDSRAPLPVTVLTGFLGSGKTTLINYFLDHEQQERIAIIENEFGAIGVDGTLLTNHANMTLVELSNGCICCSVKGELTQALHDLIAAQEAGQLHIDRLILETTGLADPAPIIQAFFVDDLIRQHVMLDAVITLVDAEHIIKQLNEHRVAAAQIGFADRILLTKTDRIDLVNKTQVLQRLHQMNAKAQVHDVMNGQVLRSVWLGIGAFDLHSKLDINTGFYFTHSDAKNQPRFQLIKETTRSWEDSIRSYVFTADELDIKKIGQFMDELVAKFGHDMLRYKGVLAIEGQTKKLIIQGVHSVVGFDYGDDWQVDEARTSLFVVIGRPLPFESLMLQFLATAS